MRVINVQEAKIHLSRLIERVVTGESVLSGKHGKPLAELSPYAPRTDPFDRMLISQAAEENLVAITRDDKFEPYPMKLIQT